VYEPIWRDAIRTAVYRIEKRRKLFHNFIQYSSNFIHTQKKEMINNNNKKMFGLCFCGAGNQSSVFSIENPNQVLILIASSHQIFQKSQNSLYFVLEFYIF
jgi:hypothetical protein